VFFPPTHGDLDVARALKGPTNELDEMTATHQELEISNAEQESIEAEGIRDNMEETMHTTISKAEAFFTDREIVRLNQIPSVHQLYQQGQLEEKPTYAHPSVVFNNIVSLAREDITKLDVTVMVNSTNIHFSADGTLDRLVFNRGGPELLQEIENFEICNEGDVKITRGYLLPAKHIFHAVPPYHYNKESKEILRNIYRKILYTAASMGATSIAIPSIGTGMLNFPRRDCASIALEEVKRYLETAEPLIAFESIVFVVYSSDDEFVYRSLLPVYFPPVKAERGTAVRPTSPVAVKTSSKLGSTSPPRRSLFGSIGDAVSEISNKRKLRIARPTSTYVESKANRCI
jgi:O-acetyl-ADP-ribose deacetylase (regulator of RNase III)